MFGMPFHSISSHFAEWYRLVALRSIAAENQERFFKVIKESTKSTNFSDDHLVANALIRIQSKIDEDMIGSAWRIQESSISTEFSRLPQRRQTIITKEMIEENPTLFAAHKRRIADYLLEGLWHEEQEGHWIFYDGSENDAPSTTTIKPMHIR
jgi:hypothetical protein